MISHLFNILYEGCGCCDKFMPGAGSDGELWHGEPLVQHPWPYQVFFVRMNWAMAWLRSDDCHCKPTTPIRKLYI